VGGAAKLRATQEALANVRKHAAAKAVRVTLSFPPDGPGSATLEVADDGRGFDPVAARLVNHLRTPTQDQLTPREAEVLATVARGLSNADVGRALSIGEATVKTHLLRVFVKLGVDDRTAAVTRATTRWPRGLLRRCGR
jgi:DNA-binding NarL/FixJ family response regulator